jgi:hypothetical protein
MFLSLNLAREYAMFDYTFVSNKFVNASGAFLFE